MSKILIEGNKVIIDGHANDLETCNTLTNLCDELSKSEKFRTVKYESGYGEFESVSENEEKKFAVAEPGKPGTPGNSFTCSIYSNNGTTILYSGSVLGTRLTEVTPTGVNHDGYSIYTYSGSKLFAGLSTSANATTPKYKPGDTIKIAANTTLYIVENIIIPEHHSSLNELFTNIAAVIREKTGDTASIVADDFPSVIRESLQMIPPISFTIQGISYLAKDGMTWEQWINSKYNTIGLTYAISYGGDKIVGTTSDFNGLIDGTDSVLLEDSSHSIFNGCWDGVDRILVEDQVVANEQYGLYKAKSGPSGPPPIEPIE